MGDPFYDIFTTGYLILLTLFFVGLGVGIHNVISKKYHMSEITLILISIHLFSQVNVHDIEKYKIISTKIHIHAC
jgi:hypothetical protein